MSPVAIGLISLAVAGCAFFLGLMLGGMARGCKEADQENALALDEQLRGEAKWDSSSNTGSFDNLGQLIVDGKRLYSLTVYGDGSGDYTLSDRNPIRDLESYGGTDD